MVDHYLMTCVVSANLKMLHIDIFDILYKWFWKWNNAFSYALGNLEIRC